jgi:hypothetical protein
MNRLKQQCVREFASDGRGPVAFHFYFPGEGGGDPLLDRASEEAEPDRVFSLNAYDHAEIIGVLGIRETPALVVMDGGHELLHVEGVAPGALANALRLAPPFCG